MIMVYYVKYLCLSYDEKVVGPLKTVSRIAYDKSVRWEKIILLL